MAARTSAELYTLPLRLLILTAPPEPTWYDKAWSPERNTVLPATEMQLSTRLTPLDDRARSPI